MAEQSTKRLPQRRDESYLRGWFRVMYKNDEKRARASARKHKR